MKFTLSKQFIKLKSNKNEKGFTLIELLVVVSVIAVLSGLILSVVSTGGIRSKARDNQRKADLKKIQVALELYFSDFRQYPASSAWVAITGSDSLSNALRPASGSGTVYLNSIPVDPVSTVGSNPCVATNRGYYYRTSSTNSRTYVLATVMEVPTSATEGLCTNLNNWNAINGGTCSANVSCYGVENP